MWSPSAPAKQKRAHIAPLADCRADATEFRKGSGQKQIKYESATRAHGLRIRKQSEFEFFCGAAACRDRRQVGCQNLPIRRGPPARSGTRAKEAGTKGDGISDAARRTICPAEGNSFSRRGRTAVPSWSPKPSTRQRFSAPIRDASERSRHKGRRNQRAPRAARFAAQKAIPICPRRSAALNSWRTMR